jgi:quinohemoprotein ethanol dehydrogenase
MILADLEIEGQKRQVIMQAPKNGFFYVIDRKSGELISANNYVPVNWATHVDLETGRPVEIADARWPGKATYLQTPGPLGGHNWHPMSFNPETGLVYIPAQELPSAYVDYTDYSYQNGLWNTGSDFVVGTLPTDAAIMQAARPALKGRLLAWDPVKQEARWTSEHNGPWNGGTLTTAGNLVFQGTADLKFSAFNAASGERLWTFFTQTGIVAAPVTYEIDGDQYVAVATGWGGAYVNSVGGIMPASGDSNVGRVLVFKLGADGKLPALESAEVDRPEPPAKFGSAEMLAKGNSLYSNNCLVCHGNSAISAPTMPNLRYSYALSDAESWNEIIVEGALAENGMPNFRGRISQEDAEAIRAFVVDQANSPLDDAFFKDLVANENDE